MSLLTGRWFISWPCLHLLHAFAVDPACVVNKSDLGTPSIDLLCGGQLCQAHGINCEPNESSWYRSDFFTTEDPSNRRFAGQITLVSHSPLSSDRISNYGFKGEVLRDAQVLFFEWLLARGGLRVQGESYSMGVLWVDDEANKEQAAKALRYASQRTGSRLALGGYGSSLHALSAPEARANDMLFITAGSSRTSIFAADTSGHPTVFTLLPDGDIYNLAIIRAVVDNAKAIDQGSLEVAPGASCRSGGCWPTLKMSILAVGSGCDDSIVEYGNQEFGEDKMGLHDEFTSDASDEDLEAALRRYQEDQTTVLFVCSKESDDLVRVVNLLEKIDYTLFAVLAKGLPQNTKYREEVASGWWQGSYVLDTTLWDQLSTVRGSFSNMTSPEFTSRFSQRFFYEPTYLAAAQFAAMCTLAAAIEAADSLDPSVLAEKVAKMNLTEFYAQVQFTSYGQVDFMPRVTQVPWPFQRSDPRYREYFRFRTIWPRSSDTEAVFPIPTWAYRRCSWKRTSPDGIVCYGNGHCSAQGDCVCKTGWQGGSCEIEMPPEAEDAMTIVVVVCASVPSAALVIFAAWCLRKRARTKWLKLEAEALTMLEASLWERETDGKMQARASQQLSHLGYSHELLEQTAQTIRKEQSEKAGVSVAYLLSDEFTEMARARTGLQDPTFYDMKDKFFFGDKPIGGELTCPRDGQLGCALVDTLEAKYRRKCTHFLSWTWGYQLSTIQDGLRQWVHREHLDPSEQFLFMCFFVNNQYRILVGGKSTGTEELQHAFEDNLKRIGKLVALLDTWDNPRYLTRIWTIFEQFVAIKADVPVTMLLTSSAADDVIDQFERGRIGISKVMEAMSKVQSEHAEAHLKADEIAVKECMCGVLLKHRKPHERVAAGLRRPKTST
eukprot:TRINITY_DN18819_c0_g1_i1.p1 TRINITY_DN18819_c0_g1~~TRINITY_DN18819_c0_g1_i1.p1  ORF type:complete len:889 (+),score=147.35 TRINITY_DN18819_c0_g1_i1:242-2908(+)